MRLSTRLISSVTTALVAGVIASPSLRPGMPAAEAAAGSKSDRMALHFRGTGNQQPTELGRFQYTTDLYSLVTGDKVGTGTNNVKFITPFIGDHVMTFRLADGQLVAHSKESIATSVLHPGFAHAGIHSSEKNIVPEKGTGAYAGRTGKATMSGWHYFAKLPEQATFNDFYLIELDPKS